jgi:predicted nucleotidyltransferase
MQGNILDTLRELGFPYHENVIMAFIGGSTQHGARIEGSSDTDWYGIFIPPASKTLGIDCFEHFEHKANTEPNSRGTPKPNSVDVAFQGLQKWAAATAKGNPTFLGFLFADLVIETDAWQEILWNKDLFLAKSHHKPFMAYADDQLQRLLGLRGQKNVNRPFLETLHGYDTKYAMHIARLLFECRELMRTGRVSYPNVEVGILKNIRAGKYPLNHFVELVNELQCDVLKSVETSPLPDKVDRSKVSDLIAEVHLNWYEVITRF